MLLNDMTLAVLNNNFGRQIFTEVRRVLKTAFSPDFIVFEAFQWSVKSMERFNIFRELFWFIWQNNFLNK